ncbi:MAG: TMEM175 family protein [Candidatus Saccharimonadales bacterium]
MNHDRLHALTDGIFAIVMTLMVLELKVPVLDHPNNQAIFDSLRNQSTTFLSYFISFTVLFVYWRAHNFTISVLAKNIDINILTFNGIFLFFVGLVPFTTHLSGAYGDTPLALSIYAVNIVLIGMCLFGMRLYIERSESIEDLKRTAEQRYGALVRIMTPILCATVSIPISFISTKAAYIILLFAVLINLHNNAASLIHRLIIEPILRIKNIINF